MDFGRAHEIRPSICTKSGIRVVEVTPEEGSDEVQHQSMVSNESLDRQLLQWSNRAARDLFLPSVPKDEIDDRLANGDLYTERITPRKDTIQYGDLVVIMESFDRLTFAYVEEKAIYSNRNGHFHHQDFVGKPFGCKIRSKNNRGYGFCYILKPTPELWARSLNHRTQIVHELDQSQIIFQLYLRPNMVVVESGTGSGAMSHSIVRSIAPHGHLHTYEFNEMRAATARQEFDKNGIRHLVTVYHRDAQTCGFDRPAQSVDAVFLDLPEPWSAVPHAAAVLKPCARLASYSPCVEQTQRTVQALEKAGFHSIKTMEYRLQEHYVDQVQYLAPPRSKRPKFEVHDNDARAAASKGVVEGEDKEEASSPEQLETETKDMELSSPKQNPTAGAESTTNPTMTNEVESTEQQQQGGGDVKSMVVARPFASMRGHTAFLTFATASYK